MLPSPKLTEKDIVERILFRDSLMLIINKPPGLPVHAGPKAGANMEQTFHWLQFGLPRKPGLAHRLDRDTSGCLILGRHPKALTKLGRLFQRGAIEKTYWAVCVGAPPEDTGVCTLPLKKRSDSKTSWWMEIAKEGAQGAMAAETRWKVLAKNDRLSLVEFSPKTGRTHQIRVHAEALGCPLLGEPVYGDLPEEFRKVPIHLHARSVKVPLYPSRDAIFAEAPLPPHMGETLKHEDLQ
ncbi:MAG: RluA family pseudouridine synthase [Bdellovibrionales bacterium]